MVFIPCSAVIAHEDALDLWGESENKEKLCYIMPHNSFLA